MCKNNQLRVIVIEDGGYATPMIHEKFEKYTHYVKGTIEQTANGIWRDEDLIIRKGLKLQFPIISIPDCKLKQEIEPPFIGEAVIGNIQNLISEEGLFISGKKIGVIGYGNIGSRIAEEARNRKAIVSVSDISHVKLLTARRGGFETKSLPKLVEESDIIIGATGRCSIGREEVLLLKNGCILVNASSKRVEIDVGELEKLSRTKERTKIGT